MLHHLVLVLAVAQVSECPRIPYIGGGEGGDINVNIAFIVSIEPGSSCNFLAPQHFISDNCILRPCNLQSAA
jgi:hypothetical protein